MTCNEFLTFGKASTSFLTTSYSVPAQLGAFCVDPVFRGSGRGDSLLDYVEQVRLWQVLESSRGMHEGP